ncbi:hypothetical protein A28LD_0045 [Idiomarina sp. A28L]|uniref:TraB/GumN family protein n=1 Tax=Idiomarina sp. A28L TaxID=1036674 RepID=UPI0002138E72|nr:TraB/GumN family protein [Idiomarina sp. A28L]EGN76313.1 hypothetical protein A28LD_0045 [Idiomarina sp. A28L]
MKGFRYFLALILFVGAIGTSSAEVLYRAQYGEQTWWLLGTIHVGGEETKLSSRAREAFVESERFWLELTPEELEKAGPLLFQYGFRNEKMSANVDSELWQQTEAALAEYAIAAAMLDNMQPWLFELMVSVQIAMAQGFDAEQGSEMQLMQWAEESGIEFEGLETAEQQIESMRNGAVESDTEFLTRLLDQIDEGALDMDNLASLWAQGDLDALMALILESMTEEQLEALLWRRNNAWMEQLKPLLDTNDSNAYFIAVGAGHFGAEQGLLELLAAEGAEITNYSSNTVK